MHLKNLQDVTISFNFIYSADLGRVESLHGNGLSIQFYDSKLGNDYDSSTIEDKSIYAKLKNLDTNFLISEEKRNRFS